MAGLLSPAATLTCSGVGRAPRQRSVAVRAAGKEVTLLDYGAGNVRSVRNAITKLGYTIKDVSMPAGILCPQHAACGCPSLCYKW